jgi:hypothetical protein
MGRHWLATGWRIRVSGMLLAGSALMAGGMAWASHAVDKTLSDLVMESERIEMVRLETTQARWNARGNLIVTDFHFVLERDLLADRAPGERFILSQGGGVIGNEGHRVSGNPELTAGERYVVFIDPDRGELFAPFVAGEQGVYRLAPDGLAHSLAGGATLHVDELLADIAVLVQARAGAPAQRFHVPNEGGYTYPAKEYVPTPFGLTPPARVEGSIAPRDETQPAAPLAPQAPIVMQETGVVIDGSPAWTAPRWHYGPTVNFPVVYDEFPHDWTWSPHDQAQMVLWNAVVNGNLFLVSNSQLGTWSWGNNRFELVGWPSNQTMIDQFGQGWGANTLAVAWSRWVGNVIVEVDIAMNPAYCWTLDDRHAADPGSSCWSFRRTMLHELGHGWGLDHPFETQNVWWDSAMNYPPKPQRQARLSADEIIAIRNRYGGPAGASHLISQWRTADNATSNHALYTPSLSSSVTLRHGQNLAVGGFQIENLGTTNLVDPSIELYLTQNWTSWTDTYVYLRTANFTTTVAPLSINGFTPNATTIASTVPTGRYYFTLWLANGTGGTRNRTSSSDPDVTVTIRNNETTLVPIEAWRVTGTGRIGPDGAWDFFLPAVAGRTYELTTCTGTGGSANFDTRIDIVGAVGNDDACGLQSRVTWTAPSSGTRVVRVRGFSTTTQGNFVMAYRQVVTDRIFANGYQ